MLAVCAYSTGWGCFCLKTASTTGLSPPAAGAEADDPAPAFRPPRPPRGNCSPPAPGGAVLRRQQCDPVHGVHLVHGHHPCRLVRPGSEPRRRRQQRGQARRLRQQQAAPPPGRPGDALRMRTCRSAPVPSSSRRSRAGDDSCCADSVRNTTSSRWRCCAARCSRRNWSPGLRQPGQHGRHLGTAQGLLGAHRRGRGFGLHAQQPLRWQALRCQRAGGTAPRARPPAPQPPCPACSQRRQQQLPHMLAGRACSTSTSPSSGQPPPGSQAFSAACPVGSTASPAASSSTCQTWVGQRQNGRADSGRGYGRISKYCLFVQ